MRAYSGVFLLLLAGCGGVRPCRSGTVFVTASFAPAVLDADTVELVVTIDGKTVKASRPHAVGQVVENYEIEFSTYPSGRDFAIDVLVRRAGLVIGRGRIGGSLLGDCTPLALAVDTVDQPDGAVRDLTAGDAMGDAARLDAGGDAAPRDILLPDLRMPDLLAPDIFVLPPDLPPPPDMARPCGRLGMPCCGGGCGDGRTVCSSGNCVACGAPGQACCANNLCTGTLCSRGICAGACGRAGQRCCQNDQCSQGTCGGGWCQPPSCVGLANSCGPGASESCCSTADSIPGGTFMRSNDPMYPATVSAFNLDEYEITVGRFRKFVEAGYGTQARPPVDKSGAGVMPGTGWDAASWNVRLPIDTAALKTAVACAGSTWTEMPGGNENRPMNCFTWYEAFAFCVWDGGRLPTEAEWNYAAAGGGEQREYPWSKPPNSKTIDATYAVYDNAAIGVVGSKSSRGDGKWSHADLVGNVYERTLDWQASYVNPCINCANTTPGPNRMVRGGGFSESASELLSSVRRYFIPSARRSDLGARCARTP